ncbi:S-layer homology domain-containing protein [Bacillus cihuensis]|uniref:S-layer homology domain-containing protein n=1 Tax=Bacillus cihuensis TaxID=1208599 RepID=UPI000404F506|nr:S-layer homology domain-containing protein [Bacillus cihuensis]
MKKNSSIFLAAMVASTITPAVVAPIQAEAAVKDFTDVPPTHWAYQMINEMKEKGIINGYKDNTFKPNATISREHVALLLSKSLDLPAIKPAVSFSDVPKSSPYYDAITTVQRAGIFDGGSSGKFKPKEPITRAQLAKVLVLAFDLKAKSNTTFKDIPSNHWASDYIKALASNGVTVGNNGNFLPNDPVTRAHYAVFLHRSINLDPDYVAPPVVKPETPNVPPVTGEVVKHDPTATYEQLLKKYGKQEIVYREVVPALDRDRFFVIDLLQDFYDINNAAGVDPKILIGEQFQFPAYKNSIVDGYIVNAIFAIPNTFPVSELVSITGTSFLNHSQTTENLNDGIVPPRKSLTYVPSYENSQYDLFEDKVFSYQPTQSGQILVDLHINSKNVVVNTKDKVNTQVLSKAPVLSSNSFLVDSSLFKSFGDVIASSTKLKMTVNNNVLEITPNSKQALLNGKSITLPYTPTYANGIYYVGVEETGELLGLQVRKMLDFQKIHIGNFSLGGDIDL